MGLDQYLKANISLPDYDSLRDEFKTPQNLELSNARTALLQAAGIQPSEQSDFGVFSYPQRVEARINIAYWRKANQIHAWFNRYSFAQYEHELENCKPIDVDIKSIGELVTICETILSDHGKAEELLPTKGGFFYGNTDYNDSYFKDLELTVYLLKPYIHKEGWSFSYYGWW